MRLVETVFLFALMVCFVFLTGCGGNSALAPSPSNAAQVSLTVRDTPPANVDALSFEVSVTGATLTPGSIDLLAGKGPIRIEVKRLEVETAFLSTANVPVGSGPFTGLNLTFANPELTFRNGTGSTLAGCPNGAVCEINPTGTLTATLSFNPALSLTANSPVGLQVDLNLSTLLTASLGVDFSANGAVSVVQSQVKPEGELEDIDDVFGQVKNKGTNTFDLTTSEGTTLTGIQVNSKTAFEDFAGCTANPPDFTCVQNNQFVEVDLEMMAGGVLLARKIEQENEQANEEDLEGIVTAVDPATSTFQMVALENLSALPNTVLGSPVNVLVQPGVTFRVDQDGLNVSSSLVNSFTDITALLVGQNVQARRQGGDGSTATPILTDRVRLRMSRFTAKVMTKLDANTFTVDTSAIGLFSSAGITEIQVDASQAEFEGVANVPGLNVPPNADTVSLRGLLFKQPAPALPVLVAGKVRKR